MNAHSQGKLWIKTMTLGWALAVGASSLPVAWAADSTASKTLFERPLQNEALAAHFDVNRDLGRAWVDVEVTPETPGSYIAAHEPIEFRRSVDGLYYDQATKQVIYRNGTTQVVCAEDQDFLWGKSLTATGHFPLSITADTRQ